MSDLSTPVPPELVEANRLKLEAEATKALAEAKAAEALAAKHAADARQTNAEALVSEYSGEGARIGLDQVLEKRQWELTNDHYHHIYRFTTPFDSSSCQKLISWLTSEVRLSAALEEKPTITIEFYSPGGEVFAGMALFDHIQWVRKEGHRVITSAVGYAASMGGILLQAGDTRRMGSEAYVMIHEVATGVRGKLSDIKDEAKFMEKLEDRILSIFAARSKTAHAANPEVCTTPLTKKQFKTNSYRTDWWLSSDEALRHGVVDEVF